MVGKLALQQEDLKFKKFKLWSFSIFLKVLYFSSYTPIL